MERFPCGPEKNTEDCPIYQKTGQCFEDTDHEYFPRRDYRTHLEKEFRELPEHKQIICRAAHDLRHIVQEAPEKPSVEEMREKVRISKLGKKAIGRAQDGKK